MTTELSHIKKLRQKSKKQFRVGGKFAVRPSFEEVRSRAVHIWRSRVQHGKPGDHLSDWLQAERELAARR